MAALQVEQLGAQPRGGRGQAGTVHARVATVAQARGASRAPAMQAGERHQAAQDARPVRIVTVSGPGAVERYVPTCTEHGALSAHFRLVDARRARRCVWCEGGR